MSSHDVGHEPVYNEVVCCALLLEMAPTVASSIQEFLGAISNIGVQLLNSILAVFNAIFALGRLLSSF